MTLDFSSDFLTIDNLVGLILRITGQADQTIPLAQYHSPTTKDPDQSGGQVIEGDRLWDWQISATPTRPPLGSVLVDPWGESWTILDVTRKQFPQGVWTAHCRNLSIFYNLTNTAAVWRATYAKSPAGEAIATYAPILVNGSATIPARFQPQTADAQILEDAEWVKDSYNVYLGTDIFDPSIPVEPASADFRLVDSAGRHYRITSYQRAERIDTLPMAKCVLIIEGAEGGSVDRLASSSSGSSGSSSGI